MKYKEKRPYIKAWHGKNNFDYHQMYNEYKKQGQTEVCEFLKEYYQAIFSMKFEEGQYD